MTHGQYSYNEISIHALVVSGSLIRLLEKEGRILSCSLVLYLSVKCVSRGYYFKLMQAYEVVSMNGDEDLRRRVLIDYENI